VTRVGKAREWWISTLGRAEGARNPVRATAPDGAGESGSNSGAEPKLEEGCIP
jgi:hypothetical protein